MTLPHIAWGATVTEFWRGSTRILDAGEGVGDGEAGASSEERAASPSKRTGRFSWAEYRGRPRSKRPARSIARVACAIVLGDGRVSGVAGSFGGRPARR